MVWERKNTEKEEASIPSSYIVITEMGAAILLTWTVEAHDDSRAQGLMHYQAANPLKMPVTAHQVRIKTGKAIQIQQQPPGDF